MGVPQVNSYSPSSSASSSSTGVDKSSLSMTDFMKILAAQLSNQDVLNPTDNTQFISQMAQVTTLQAITKLTETASSELEAIKMLSEQSTVQFGSSIVGKNVVIDLVDKDGKHTKVNGIVDGVKFGDDATTISVGGKDYNIASVAEVDK